MEIKAVHDATAFRMQAFGEYSNDGTALSMKARDYKDATDLVASPVIIDRAAFNQGQNAQYKPRIEHSETMDSLVARGPHAVAIPIHDQATRNAGKRGDKQDGKGNGLGIGKPGDPCPTLTKGDKHAVLYENHPNDSQVTGPLDVAPQAFYSTESRCDGIPAADLSPPLKVGSNGGGQPPAVAIAFQTSEVRLTGKLTEKSVCPTRKANTKAGDTEVKVVLYENHPNDSRVTGPHDVDPSCVSRYGTGGGNVPLVQEAVPFRDPSPTLTSKMQGQAGWAPYNEDAHLVGAVAVDTYNQALQEKAAPIRSAASDVCHTGGVINPADRMAVRRLSPRECERLQGFPDDHTLIPWRNKPADQCPDGPRYKALGNSMAVPCMAWIGKRIDAVEKTK